MAFKKIKALITSLDKPTIKWVKESLATYSTVYNENKIVVKKIENINSKEDSGIEFHISLNENMYPPYTTNSIEYEDISSFYEKVKKSIK